MRWFGLSSALSPTITNDSHVSGATPPEFSLTLPFSSFVHHLSGPDTHVLTQTSLKITECTHTQTHLHIYVFTYKLSGITKNATEGGRKGRCASVVCDVM